MEFKGTPLPWYFEYNNCDHSPYEWYNITSESDGNILNRRYSDRSLTDDQMRANALLISKAPEMLEMLIKINDFIQENKSKNYMIELLNRKVSELNNLITQSTQL